MAAESTERNVGVVTIPRFGPVLEMAISVVSFFVTIAAVNIGLGISLALVYDRLVPPSDRSRRTWPGETESPIAQVAEAGVGPAAEEGGPIGTPGTAPAHWRTITSAIGVEDARLIEAALWVSSKQTEALTLHLIDLEDAARSDGGESPWNSESWTASLQQQADELREASEQISNEVDDADDRAQQALPDLLLDYAVQFEQYAKAIRSTEPAGSRRLANRDREPIRKHLDLAFRLRDELGERLSRELQRRDRIGAIPAAACLDQQVSLYNRIGLEYLLQVFVFEAGNENLPISLALVDIDHFQRVHQQVGTRVADRILNAFARLMEEDLRHNRGFDRVTRVGGASFVFLLGNTLLPGAEFVCERLRQKVEATSFRVGTTDLDLTVSCGATTMVPGETLPVAMGRLRAALAESRRAGRNRSCVDGGEGLVVVQPTQLQVTGKRIEVPTE